VGKLTKRIVESIEPNIKKPMFLWDSALSGFGIKVLSSGKRRYVVQYRVGSGRSAKQRWLTIGTHGILTCEQARNDARQILAAVARGEDPQGRKISKREAPTMKNLWERFSREQLPQKKPSTAHEYEMQWNNHLKSAFGRKKVTELKLDDVETFHKKLRRTPYLANRILALLSSLLSYAERIEWRPPRSNPVPLVSKFKERARERYLTQSEIQQIGGAIAALLHERRISVEAAAAIKLLLLTGARLNEVLKIKKSWIDTDLRIITLPDSKTGKKIIYLSKPAVTIVQKLMDRSDGDYLLPGRVSGQPIVNLRKPWLRVCNRAGIKAVRLHDLRHTAASIAAGQGASLPVIGKMLGHKQPSTTQRYAHVDRDPALLVVEAVGVSVGAALSDQTGTNAL